MKNKKGFFVKPMTESFSRAIQELAFEAGYKWIHADDTNDLQVRHVDKPILIFETDKKRITYSEDFVAEGFAKYTIETAILFLKKKYKNIVLKLTVCESSVESIKKILEKGLVEDLRARGIHFEKVSAEVE